ncbi:hypothetical protein D3C75_419620 [compost metagenome]
MQIADQRKRQHNAEQIDGAMQDQRVGKRHRGVSNPLAAGQHNRHIIQTNIQAVEQNIRQLTFPTSDRQPFAHDQQDAVGGRAGIHCHAQVLRREIRRKLVGLRLSAQGHAQTMGERDLQTDKFAESGIVRQGIFHFPEQRSGGNHQLSPQLPGFDIARVTGVIAKTKEDRDGDPKNTERRDRQPNAQRGVPGQHDDHGNGEQKVKKQPGKNFGQHRTVPDKNQTQPVLLRTNNHSQLHREKRAVTIKRDRRHGCKYVKKLWHYCQTDTDRRVLQ